MLFLKSFLFYSALYTLTGDFGDELLLLEDDISSDETVSLEMVPSPFDELLELLLVMLADYSKLIDFLLRWPKL